MSRVRYSSGRLFMSMQIFMSALCTAASCMPSLTRVSSHGYSSLRRLKRLRQEKRAQNERAQKVLGAVGVEQGACGASIGLTVELMYTWTCCSSRGGA